MTSNDGAATTVAESLAALPGVAVRRAEPMAAHVPLRVGGPAELWVEAVDADVLKEVLRTVRAARLGWRVHWPMEDWIVRDEGVPGVVVRPGRGFEQVERQGDDVRLGGAATFGTLAGHPHLAHLATWPGTPGGLLGSGEGELMAGVCAEVRWLKGRTIETVAVPPGEGPPAPPQTAVVVDVLLRASHRASGPAHLFWRKPSPIGALFADAPAGTAATELERARLSGTRLRSWRMSSSTPGVVVNLGGGTCQDLLLLVRGLEKRVEKERGVALKLRLPVVGGARSRRAR